MTNLVYENEKYNYQYLKELYSYRDLRGRRYSDLKGQERKLRIVDDYSITKSSSEVTFNSITCDFTGCKKEDLPKKYQEVKIVEDGNILFFGYVDECNFKEMREQDVETDIEITLLSPMKLATLRTVILMGTYQLNDLLLQVLQPLIDDGYEIVEMEVINRTVTVNYPLDTVEYCMNNLSNKFNFWWFVDELKKIYIKDLSKMIDEKPDYKYDEENRIPYLQYVKPTISAEGYANVVNFKNVRVYEYSNLEMNESAINSSYNPMIDEQLTSTIKNQGQISFNQPCDIATSNIIKSGISIGKTDSNLYPFLYGLYIKGTYTDNSTFEVFIKYNQLTGEYSKSSNVGFDGNEEDQGKEFLLIKDSFFASLITGFRFNNENKNIKSIEKILSDSALIWSIIRMYNDEEILDKKGIISETGIVETTVDMKESWKTLEELREIGISYMNKNSVDADELELKIDTTCDMQVGETIEINRLLFNGTYIITSIQMNFVNNENVWIIKCKNGNVLDNFIDIFRSENTQDSEEKTYKVEITHYMEEKINEVFEVVK